MEIKSCETCKFEWNAHGDCPVADEFGFCRCVSVKYAEDVENCPYYKKQEPTPFADEISSSDEIYTSIIGGRKEVVKMNDEKLTQLNELSEKIKTKKAVLKTIDELSTRSGVVITACISGRVEVPEELSNVFFTLLKDYYQKQLDALEKQFEAM